MKQLMNTLYILSSNKYLSLDGENVVVKEDEKEVSRIPLHNIQEIVAFGYVGASPALMGACAQRGIGLCFLTINGRFLARVNGKECGNVVLRKTQYAISEIQSQSLHIAANFITGKLFNSRWVLERTIRDYPMRSDIQLLKQASLYLKEQIVEVRNTTDFDTLRGIEGKSAQIYFSVFDQHILQQKESFEFKARSRKPPLDRINALLSFAYVLLTNMCANALETVGLDPYVGFMHTDRPGRMSLALDLMEELRAPVADRFVISLINKKMIVKDDFLVKENEAVILSENAKKVFINAWQNKKSEIITHPFLEEKIQWGLVPYVQALLLARHLRGDLDQYPPFLWK